MSQLAALSRAKGHRDGPPLPRDTLPAHATPPHPGHCAGPCTLLHCPWGEAQMDVLISCSPAKWAGPARKPVMGGLCLSSSGEDRDGKRLPRAPSLAVITRWCMCGGSHSLGPVPNSFGLTPLLGGNLRGCGSGASAWSTPQPGGTGLEGQAP